MRNVEILGIVTAYTEQKEAIAKARKEGKAVDELRLPASIAWKRRVNIDKLFQAKKLIDEAMDDVKKRYSDDEHSNAATSENGEQVRTIKAEYQAEFMKEQGDILIQNTDVDIKKIKIEDIDGIALTDEDMDTLSFMIEE